MFDLIAPVKTLAGDVAAMRATLERVEQALVALAAQLPQPPPAPEPPVVALREPGARRKAAKEGE